MLEEAAQQVLAEPSIPNYYSWSFREFSKASGFRSKHVLEVGGSSLPKRLIEALGVESWTSVDILGHKAGAYQQKDYAEHYEQTPIRPLDELDARCLHETYSIYDGDVARLPSAAENLFDLVVSVNAFEHLLELPLVLSKLHGALRTNGMILSSFGPIWSCAYGSHFWVTSDWNFQDENQMPIPLHGHLLFTPPELFRLVREAGKPFSEATEAVHQIYHSDRVNRLFYDDYVDYFELSPFASFTIVPFYRVAVDEKVQEELEHRYPGRKDFETYSAIATLTKA